MKKKISIQQVMRQEIEDKKVFDLAQKYAYQYMDGLFEWNVFPTQSALDQLREFEENLPEQTTTATDVITMLNEIGSAATVAHLGGRYFGFVTGSSIPVALAAKNLGTYWDQNTPLNVLSPLASKLESVCERWLREIFHLPEHTVAGFVSGTSAANFCGLAAARFRLLKNQGWDVGLKGIFGAPPLRVVIGKDAHSTVVKALGLLGFGTDNMEWIEVDDQGRIRADLVPALDDRTLLVLQAGNVNSGSFDDFRSLGERARNAKAWVHIDGAFGLWAAATNSLRHLTDGIELANSWAVDGHKTLNTPYDSGIALCDDPEAMVSALHMSGSYIVLSKERDGMFYTPEMSRRARVIELWAAMKYLGKNGINELVEGLHSRALQFADELADMEGFNVVNEVVFNQVLVQCPSDELTSSVISRIQELRECWVGGSVWKGKKVIRISVCSWATTDEDIKRSARSFAKAYKECTMAKEVGFS